MSVIDGIVMRSWRIVVLGTLQQIALEQLQINHRGIEKMRLLARESIYWDNINADNKNPIKTAQHVLNFRPCS